MTTTNLPPLNLPPLTILHTESSLGWGGQEIRILTEALGMMQRGYQVTLLCPPQATIFKAAQERGLPVEALPIARKNLTGLIALRNRLATTNADVIITHSSTDSWLTALASLLVRHPPPMVRLRHISAAVANNFPTRWLYGTASRMVITTGEGIRTRLIEINGIPPKQIISIPTGIDLEQFCPQDQTAARILTGLPESVPIIGIVATLRSWKGHLDLLEAFATLQNQEALLVIIGDGPQREVLAQRIIELAIPANRVRMTHHQENIPTWLNALDLFVLPSYANEGVPQALMQAMACGLAVISTPIGGIPEMIQPDITGILTPPRQIAALRQAMDTLLANPQQRRQLGEAARRKAKTSCSMSTMLERMDTVLRTVITEEKNRH